MISLICGTRTQRDVFAFDQCHNWNVLTLTSCRSFRSSTECRIRGSKCPLIWNRKHRELQNWRIKGALVLGSVIGLKGMGGSGGKFGISGHYGVSKTYLFLC